MAKSGLVEQAIQKCGLGRFLRVANLEICEFLRKNVNFGTYPAAGTVSALQPHEQANSEKTRQNMVLGPGHSCRQSTGEKSGVETLPDARRGRQVVSGQLNTIRA